MKISDILGKVLSEGEKFGFDALDSLGHPVTVVNASGDKVGDVADVTMEAGSLVVHLGE